MNWHIEFLEEAKRDLKKLDHTVQIQVLKGIDKVSQNPLPMRDGGYGKPLGHKGGSNLTNLLKIKLRDLGIRVVYKVEYTETTMKIIVISARTDGRAYREPPEETNMIYEQRPAKNAGLCHVAKPLTDFQEP